MPAKTLCMDHDRGVPAVRRSCDSPVPNWEEPRSKNVKGLGHRDRALNPTLLPFNDSQRRKKVIIDHCNLIVIDLHVVLNTALPESL